MDDLISKKGLLNKINAYVCGSQDKEFICKLIAEMPTIDAVEVVQCKNCKYFELNHWDGIIITAHEICNKWADGCKTNKDGYCFLGERKTDDS